MPDLPRTELPSAEGDRHRESYTLENGRVSQRVRDLNSASTVELLRLIATDLSAVRRGLELALGEEIPDDVG